MLPGTLVHVQPTSPFDPAIQMAHDSALRSIARVVEETAQPTPPEQALEQVSEQLRRGGTMVITGAGVSTESGIPDYRGPRGSLSRHRPMTYQEFRYDALALQRYWARSFVGWRHLDQARPNRTHFALVELERAGCVSGVVTQNVDGLHSQAGSKNVIALHGDLARVVCLNCHATEDRHHLDQRIHQANPSYLEQIELDPAMVNPDGDVTLNAHQVSSFRLVGCQVCGSKLLKPDVVYFGEPVPKSRRERASALLEQSTSVLVAGSSLAVMSGYRFVLDALKQGKEVSIINGGPGRADARAQTLWRTQVGPAFDDLLDALHL
ncbi:NAD-dependent protein deacetylase [Corynebacterium pelargi]|uniref:protein acetyllysine N-acetyltransferase n=2 Tax=Corynebacterium pelargi TaxID=1471400 RepID=A0A410WBJ8_9CORY|nr:NAD-dependent protein deacetylase [Corynebacterium pelargi]GGG73272.1 NAD-dependent protein deacetylase [Corynebacterium pelargi]